MTSDNGAPGDEGVVRWQETPDNGEKCSEERSWGNQNRRRRALVGARLIENGEREGLEAGAGLLVRACKLRGRGGKEESRAAQQEGRCKRARRVI